MICEKSAKKFCCEDISLIENYQEAINDSERWECHHKLGVNKSRQELKENDLYFNRPANELIFLTKKEHRALHMSVYRKNGILPTRKGKDCNFYGVHNTGEKHPFYGKHHTDESRRKMSKSHKGGTSNRKGTTLTDEHKRKISKAHKDKNLSDEHKRKISESLKKADIKKPKTKYKWLTPTGEIKIMDPSKAKRWHPDWIKIGEV